MYCQECGHRNNNSGTDLYCENCGVKLEDNSGRLRAPAPIQIAGGQPRPAKPVSKSAKVVVFSGIGLIMLIAALVVAGSFLSSPQRVVKAYFESYAAGDYEKAYGCLSLPESTFITREAFNAYLQNQGADRMDVVNYEITIPARTSSSLVLPCVVRYVLQGKNKPELFPVDLVLQSKRQLLFFSQYKVGVGEMIAHDYRIYAPGDISVLLDGIELAAEKLPADQYGHMRCYTAGTVFKGKHQLIVTSGLYEDIKQDLIIDAGDPITLDNLEVKEYAREIIAANAYNVFAAMVSSAIKQEALMAIPGIAEILTSHPGALEGIQDAYKSLCYQVKNEDGSGLKSVEFKGFEDISSSSTVNSEGLYICNLEFGYTYVALELNRSTGKLTEEKFSYERVSTLSFSFAYENNGWKVVSLDDFELYY